MKIIDNYEKYISRELLELMRNKNERITISSYDNYYLDIYISDYKTITAGSCRSSHNKIYYIYGIK